MESTDILALRRFCLREVRRSEQKATQARLNDMTSQDEGWLQHESTLYKPMFKEKRGTLSFFIDIYIYIICMIIYIYMIIYAHIYIYILHVDTAPVNLADPCHAT